MNNPFLSVSNSWAFNYDFKIERPKAPFPGQMMQNQKPQHVFEEILTNLFDTMLLNEVASNNLIELMFDQIRRDFPDANKLRDILYRDIPVNTVVDRETVINLKNDIMNNAYSKSEVRKYISMMNRNSY